MKCPKCGFTGLDSEDACKKCGKDLAETKKKLGLTNFGAGDFRFRQSPEREFPSTETTTAELIDAGQQRERIVRETGFENKAHQIGLSAVEQEEEGQKDIDIPQQPVDLIPDQKEKSPIEPMEENFQFGVEKEDDFFSAEIEDTADAGKIEKNIDLSEEFSDDFNFHSIPKPQPIDTLPVEDHDPSSLLSLDPESESKDADHKKPEE